MPYYLLLLIIYGSLIVLMSLCAFIAFVRDKKLAVNGKERTKEKTLLALAVFNGALGAFIGRIVAHHKTDKKYFSLTIYLGLLCQVAILVALVLFAFIIK